MQRNLLTEKPSKQIDALLQKRIDSIIRSYWANYAQANCHNFSVDNSCNFCAYDKCSAPEQTDAGALFGGQSSIANNTTALTGELADMPVIVEEYTATWCSNCVDVEMAIKNIADQENIKSYMFHRSIGETQDPFGTDELDERWESRYDRRAPPTAVFNGTEMKIGSVADGENLEEDYTNMARVSLRLKEQARLLGLQTA